MRFIRFNFNWISKMNNQKEDEENLKNLQQEESISNRKIIKKLHSETSNSKINQQEIAALYENFEVVNMFTYFPYNSQYEDFGWGCAWRAIQTLLSSLNVQANFKQLVQKYSLKSKLIEIYRKMKGSQEQIEQLSKTKWSPEETENCWAEPFICKLICFDHKIKTQLILINGYPKAYAPQFVFQKIVKFEQFWSLIKIKIPYSPIMIDDGLLALTIIGYREDANTRHIILADPHITSNNTNTKRYVGIYEVVLDLNGKLIDHNVKDQMDYPFSSFQKISFETKKWMAISILQ